MRRGELEYVTTIGKMERLRGSGKPIEIDYAEQLGGMETSVSEIIAST